MSGTAATSKWEIVEVRLPLLRAVEQELDRPQPD